MVSRFKQMTTGTSIGLFCLFILAGLGAAAQNNNYVDGIAAVVNGEVITVYEVLQDTQPLESRLRRQYEGEELKNKIEELRKNVAERLIEHELLYAQFENSEYQLPSEFVEQNVNRIVVNRTGGNWEQFRQQLREQGMTLADFREELKKRLAVDVLLEQKIRRQITVTPAEIADYYQQHLEAYRQGAQVKLSVIAVSKRDASEREVEERIEAIRNRLEKGEPFASVAEALSDDVSRKRGGELGWIKVEGGRQAFIDAARKLAKGEVSPPLDLDDAVYVIKVTGRKEARNVPLAKVSEEIEQKIRQIKEKRQLDSYIEKLAGKFYVKRYF